ncbi:hypothetical protein BS50DRAFT_586311 [Corynespora cassiicola Philippines]|uniref:RRM domain-containing protein n=1 Tax=Corynespora cassiicola Philippines TaxID=1448308 RepID=A0A2T2NU77_CORCC|nr:hypothetical protein BS50DRAFT_586311 [Corynespora cassiicola Philippines]
MAEAPAQPPAPASAPDPETTFSSPVLLDRALTASPTLPTEIVIAPGSGRALFSTSLGARAPREPLSPPPEAVICSNPIQDVVNFAHVFRDRYPHIYHIYFIDGGHAIEDLWDSVDIQRHGRHFLNEALKFIRGDNAAYAHAYAGAWTKAHGDRMGFVAKEARALYADNPEDLLAIVDEVFIYGEPQHVPRAFLRWVLKIMWHNLGMGLEDAPPGPAVTKAGCQAAASTVEKQHQNPPASASRKSKTNRKKSRSRPRKPIDSPESQSTDDNLSAPVATDSPSAPSFTRPTMAPPAPPAPPPLGYHDPQFPAYNGPPASNYGHGSQAQVPRLPVRPSVGPRGQHGFIHDRAENYALQQIIPPIHYGMPSRPPPSGPMNQYGVLNAFPPPQNMFPAGRGQYPWLPMDDMTNVTRRTSNYSSQSGRASSSRGGLYNPYGPERADWADTHPGGTKRGRGANNNQNRPSSEFGVGENWIGASVGNVKSLWIGDLPNLREDILRQEIVDFFSRSNIRAIRVKTKPSNLHYAFVDFATTEDCRRGLAIPEKVIQGKQVAIKVPRFYTQDQGPNVMPPTTAETTHQTTRVQYSPQDARSDLHRPTRQYRENEAGIGAAIPSGSNPRGERVMAPTKPKDDNAHTNYGSLSSSHVHEKSEGANKSRRPPQQKQPHSPTPQRETAKISGKDQQTSEPSAHVSPSKTINTALGTDPVASAPKVEEETDLAVQIPPVAEEQKHKAPDVKREAERESEPTAVQTPKSEPESKPELGSRPEHELVSEAEPETTVDQGFGPAARGEMGSDDEQRHDQSFHSAREEQFESTKEERDHTSFDIDADLQSPSVDHSGSEPVRIDPDISLGMATKKNEATDLNTHSLEEPTTVADSSKKQGAAQTTSLFPFAKPNKAQARKEKQAKKKEKKKEKGKAKSEKIPAGKQNTVSEPEASSTSEIVTQIYSERKEQPEDEQVPKEESASGGKEPDLPKDVVPVAQTSLSESGSLDQMSKHDQQDVSPTASVSSAKEEPVDTANGAPGPVQTSSTIGDKVKSVAKAKVAVPKLNLPKPKGADKPKSHGAASLETSVSKSLIRSSDDDSMAINEGMDYKTTCYEMMQANHITEEQKEEDSSEGTVMGTSEALDPLHSGSPEPSPAITDYYTPMQTPAASAPVQATSVGQSGRDSGDSGVELATPVQSEPAKKKKKSKGKKKKKKDVGPTESDMGEESAQALNPETSVQAPRISSEEAFSDQYRNINDLRALRGNNAAKHQRAHTAERNLMDAQVEEQVRKGKAFDEAVNTKGIAEVIGLYYSETRPDFNKTMEKSLQMTRSTFLDSAVDFKMGGPRDYSLDGPNIDPARATLMKDNELPMDDPQKMPKAGKTPFFPAETEE